MMHMIKYIGGALAGAVIMVGTVGLFLGVSAVVAHFFGPIGVIFGVVALVGAIGGAIAVSEENDNEIAE